MEKNGRSDSEPCGDKEIMLNFKAFLATGFRESWTIVGPLEAMVNARAFSRRPNAGYNCWITCWPRFLFVKIIELQYLAAWKTLGNDLGMSHTCVPTRYAY